MTIVVRMPVSIASRKGVSALANEAADHRVILTSLGRAVAVVDSAERIDEDLRRMREAARTVVEAAAEFVAGRTTVLSLDEVCTRLGLTKAAVEAKAADLAFQ